MCARVILKKIYYTTRTQKQTRTFYYFYSSSSLEESSPIPSAANKFEASFTGFFSTTFVLGLLLFLIFFVFATPRDD